MTEPCFDGSFVAVAAFDDPESRTWADELLDERQWMGHRDKMPLAPWGDADAPTDCREHGCTADECECDARWKWSYTPHYRTGHQVRSVLPMGEIDGLAFLQQEEDPYVFVDGDDVRCPETGEVHPGFKAVLAHLGATYCDISTSGAGVHANYRGTVPSGVTEPSWELDDEPWGANDDVPAVEIYETTHVCVATGKHIPGTPVEVNNWDDDAVEELLTATGHLDDDSDGDDHDTGGAGAGVPPLTNGDDDTGDGDVSLDDVTTDVQDVFDAIEALDARRVAAETIVDEWNDPSTAKYRAFLPEWGSSSDGGTANIVTEDAWKDKGRLGGKGGPVVMAAIDLKLVRPRHAENGCVSGAEYWACVEHLRDLGFPIPEYDPDTGGDGDVSPYYGVVDEYAPPGTDPVTDDTAFLLACIRAREDGAVPGDADVPDRALRPVVEYVTSVSWDSDSIGSHDWSVVRDVFDALDEERARNRFLDSRDAAGNPGGETA